MVVAPKYKHYDGISYCGETRVRIKDQEDRSTDQQTEVDLSSLLLFNGHCGLVAVAGNKQKRVARKMSSTGIFERIVERHCMAPIILSDNFS